MHFQHLWVSSQCPDTGIQLLCNLIKNVCFSVRQLPLAHQLSYKQNFWIPVSGHWDDTICCAIYLQKRMFIQL
ncbi:hypothetical protein NMD99_02175 [Wolbachia endosymbiont of Listronotus oregonensis]|uniref:hypothetical protein n=1 Tax=Wolbachia endosymbiont of Listronotus oregonensis TaxID=2969106 RepID=UPI0028166455|nr:hypothetical protein [Wolbachia endosymbiont of Listronotus oregonensis]WMT84819.1 hypothetical protein NMD99_02175 [Wolbachia endosymbiont of Listronotus oregonensis]